MSRSFVIVLSSLLILIVLASCEPTPETTPAPPADNGVPARAAEIAQAYVDGFYQTFSDMAYDVGYTDVDYSRLPDYSLDGLEAWRLREDAWLEELQALDAAELEGTSAAVAYAYALDRMEASVAMRACRFELWKVSPAWTGWQSALASTFAQQPVGSDEARADAVARAREVVRFLKIEVSNLRLGLRTGYTAPRSNVEAVLDQVEALLAAPVEESPFYEPATRDTTPEFIAELRTVVADEIRPAIRTYRDFLADEYLEAAREESGVNANRNGAECYRSSIRFYTSLPLTAQEIHDRGLEQMARIQDEMRAIGERSFGTTDIRALLERVRSDERYTFESGEEILAYAQAAIDRAKAAVPGYFGLMPESEVVIRPYPDYMKRSGGGFYNAGTPDGSRPGVYELGTWEPRSVPKAGLEATTFHETYPGHHLQVMIGLEREGVHPILRYLYFSGMGEGWALYTERLAEEMGLYSSDLDRLGLLSNEAWRAARLVVDPGMHALGWPRQKALDYLLANTAQSEAEANYEINRYLAVPAQATSYMTGSLEIQRLRALAEERLGEDFDIKAFHDRTIEDGTVTLGMLRDKIERWIEVQL